MRIPLLSLVWITVTLAGAGPAETEPTVVSKTVPARIFLVHREEIRSLDEVAPIEFTARPRLRRFVRNLGYDPVPPVEYHVRFASGKNNEAEIARLSARLLEIAIPLTEVPLDTGRFAVKKSEPFKCLSLVFDGPSSSSGKYWLQLYNYVKRNGIATSDDNREISDADSTELQLGIR